MATFDCDWVNNQMISIAISENTTFTFTDPLFEAFNGDYRFSYIKVTNITGSPKNLVWPTNMSWPSGSGQNTVSSNRTDIYEIMQVLDFATGVVSYYGSVLGNNYQS